MILNAINKNQVKYDSNYVFHRNDSNRNNTLDPKELSIAIDTIFKINNMEPSRRNDFKINAEFISLYDNEPKDNIYNINEFRKLNTDINAKIQRPKNVETFVEGALWWFTKRLFN